MRLPLPFGVIAASRLLLHAAAQASYGDEVGAGNSAGQDDSPQGSAAGAGAGSPYASNGHICSVQGTTTVFVTIYPSSPTSIGSNSPAGSTGLDGTVNHTVYPTHTVQVSPLNSASDNAPTIHAFTTLTISDLWGTGSGSDNNPVSTVSGFGSSPVTTGPGSNDASGSMPGTYSGASYTSESKPVESSNSVDAVDTTGGPETTTSPYSSGNVVNTEDAPQGTVRGNGEGVYYTTVTDTVVEWVTGSDGSSSVTILSAHTMTVASAEGPFPEGQTASGLSPHVTCWTVTGSDGKETVIESIISTNGGNSGIAVSTIVSPVTDSNVGAQGLTASVPEKTPVTTITAAGPVPVYTGPGMTTTTAITILGNDGISTIVHSTWVLQTAPVTTASDVLSTKYPVSAQGAGGHDVTSQTAFTILGPDGRPTVIESILVIPASVVLATDLPQNLPNGITVQATPLPATEIPASGLGFPGASLTCSSFTLLGSDGKLTVVETTYLVSGLSGPTGSPDGSGTLSGVVTDMPDQITAGPSQVVPGQSSPQGLSTCVSYTVIGADGRPTVIESTIAMPNSNPLPTGTIIGLPSVVSPALTNRLPQGTQLPPQGGQPVTTSITIDIIGPDGIVTPVIETVVLTPPVSVPVSATLPTTTIGLPSVVSQIVPDLPQGVSLSSPAAIPMTTALTIPVVGPNGVISTLVRTIVNNFSPFPAFTSGFVSPSTEAGAHGAGSPGSILQGYESGAYPVPMTAPSPPVVLTSAPGMLPAGTNGIPNIPVFTVVTGADGMTSLSIVTLVPATAYGNPASSAVRGLPASEPSISANPLDYGFPEQPPATAIRPQTSTWLNVIPEPTTTRTMKFPLTTLTTVTVPAKVTMARRGVLRRASVSLFPGGWSNSTSAPSQPSQETDAATNSPPPNPGRSSRTMTTSESAPTLEVPIMDISPSSYSGTCPLGSNTGNNTLNFDNLRSGPLFNPSGDIWFSEGFLISPLSSRAVQGYMPSSGGQLIEFVPPSLTSQQSSDTAEIGVGPNFPNPCFRFNLYGMNLGCAARAAEQWCEFHISAYAYNQGASNEMSIAWSEVKRVPACPGFPNSPCSLTPVTLDGYQNITSVLIQVFVGTDLRTWWADDLTFGWTDNSCEAAQCREAAVRQHVKREVVESAVRRGVWSWTPGGLQKLDDESVWDAAV